MSMAKKLLRLLILVLLLAVLVVGAVALVKRKQTALAEAPKYGLRPVPVHVTTARMGDLPIQLNYLGIVEPVRLANVSARLTAAVERVLIDEGTRVKAGDLLITLDSRDIEQDIAAAQARIAQAKADLAGNHATVESLSQSLSYWQREAQRDKTLAEKKDIAASQAEATADKVNEFKGRLQAGREKSSAIGNLIQSLEKSKDQLETKASYCTITSPYDGVVSRRDVDPGDLAAPGKILMVVEDRTQLKVALSVPQGDVEHLSPGLPVTFQVGDAPRSAAITNVFPSLNRARMLRAEIVLSGEQAGGLSCGQYLPVSVTLRHLDDVVLIPASCLIENPMSHAYVFVVENDKLSPRPVEVLSTSGDDVAVTGVASGAEVVTNTFLGWARLSSGIRVEVTP
jgi:RND family efflux transporter MFP subunit